MIGMMTDITTRLAEVKGIVSGYDGGAIPFEQAYVLARFYYDFQDTNALIADAEVMAGVIPVTFLKAASSSTIFSRYSQRLSA